jgi:hypothetical protein
MGANAQTTVPTFTAGQVLTAAQMNDSARTGVPVFADTSARDAGFGGTGEKTLAEGQLCYLEDSDVVQYYDGSSWATVGPTAAVGLVLISSTTIGSAVATVNVTSAFSATYENYRIIISGGAASSAQQIQFQLGATTTGYYAQSHDAAFGGATGTVAQSNAAFWNIGSGSSDALSSVMDIFQPYATEYTSFTSRSVMHAVTGYEAARGGYLNNTTSYTDFTISLAASATFTGGTIRVYGYKNS